MAYTLTFCLYLIDLHILSVGVAVDVAPAAAAVFVVVLVGVGVEREGDGLVVGDAVIFHII